MNLNDQTRISPMCLPGPAHITNQRACDWDCGLIASGYHTTVYIINPVTCNICYAYGGHKHCVTSIAFKNNDFMISSHNTTHNSDSIVASGDCSGKIHIWGIWSTSNATILQCVDTSPVVCIQWDYCCSSAINVLYRSGRLVCFDIVNQIKLWEYKDTLSNPLGFSNSNYSRSSFGI